MSREFTPITIAEFAELPADDFIWAEVQATNPGTGYDYSYRFHAASDGRPGRVAISTKNRQEFLEKGTEEEAQTALIEIGHQTRKLTGGVFDIHPFHGAVYGTKLTPVAPGFLVDLAQMDEGLSMGIALSDEGYTFDDESTQEAVAIGTTVVIPSPRADRMLAYMKAHKANPNQQSRDQAVANNLGERWDDEFKRFNGQQPRWWRRGIPTAIDLTPVTASLVIEKLAAQSVLSEVAVTWIYTRQQAEELEASFKRRGSLYL